MNTGSPFFFTKLKQLWFGEPHGTIYPSIHIHFRIKIKVRCMSHSVTLATMASTITHLYRNLIEDFGCKSDTSRIRNALSTNMDFDSLRPSDVFGVITLGQIGSGNDLLPDGPKPLPEPMLTYHQWGLVAFIWGQFRKTQPPFIKNSLQITYLKLNWNLPEANELTRISLHNSQSWLWHKCGSSVV